jgi:NAD(P)-dependent dehydrogenase (short-subunit alcohol dehydrogenase family)
LASSQWVRAKQNVIVVGAAGAGKSFLGGALAQAACRQGFRALCARTPRLLQQLAIARADGTYAGGLARLAKVQALVLDDFLLAQASLGASATSRCRSARSSNRRRIDWACTHASLRQPTTAVENANPCSGYRSQNPGDRG